MLDSYSMKITPFPARLDCVNSDITISLAGSPRIPVYDFFSIALPSSVGKEYQRWCTVVKRRLALPLATGQLKRTLGFPGDASGKEPTCQCRRHKRRRFDPWVEKLPCRRAWQSTPVFLLGEAHGLRSLAGYSPLGCKELDTAEAT